MKRTENTPIPGVSHVSKVKVASNEEKLFLMADLAYRYCNDVAHIQDPRKLHRILTDGYHTEIGEIFQRPRITLESGGDCDDAAICVIAWCINQRPTYVPWMLETCGVKSASHVTTYIRVDGIWQNFDTLPYEWPENMRAFQQLTRSEYEKACKEKYGS